MAGFCSQCGRPLADGEVCTCTQQAAQGQQFNAAGQQNYQQYNAGVQQNNAGTQQYNAGAQQFNAGTQQYNAGAQQFNAGAQQFNGGAQQYNPGQQLYDANGQPVMYAAPPQPSAAAIKFKQFGMDTLNSLKNPVKAVGEMVARNDFLYGLIMVCVDAVIVFFVTLILAARVNSMIGTWIGYKLPSAMMAFITFLGVIAAYAAQAGTLLGMSKAFGAGKSITFVQSLTYVGVKAFYSAMVAIVSCLFCMINIPFGLVIFVIGSTFAFLIGAMSYYQSLAIDGSKKVYVLLVVYVADLIVVYLAARLLFSAVTSSIGSSLSSMYSLYSLFN